MKGNDFLGSLGCAFGFYLATAGAAGNAITCTRASCEFSPINLVVFALCLSLLPLARVDSSTLKNYVVIIAVFMTPWLVGLFFSQNIFLVAQKLWGLTFASFFAAIYLTSLLNRGGENAVLKSITSMLVIVLGATIAYKLATGFWERGGDSRFLFNGPIVFGWLMGLGTAYSLIRYIKGKSSLAAALTTIFFASLLWSQSKGPILALCIAIVTMAFVYRSESTGSSLRLFSIIFVAALASVFLLQDQISSSRISALSSILTTGADESDGSIGIRYAMYSQTVDVSLSNPIFGIGPGNFSTIFPILIYPHNVHYEVLLELGLIVFVGYCTFGLIAYRKASPLIRVSLAYFATCLMFSGDASYLRYLLPLALVALNTKNFRRDQRRTFRLR